MNHFSGSGRGVGPDDEDDYHRVPPYGDHGGGGGGGGNPYGGPERQFTYYTEERYWTDYLRIALPVIGVIFILALGWWWISSLLGGGNEDKDALGAAADPTTTLVISTPETGAGLTGTPRPIETETVSPSGGTLAAGGTAVVANTGGTGVNMRDTASTSGEIVTTLDEGTELEVTGAAVKADGYTWWPVKSGSTSGYVVEDYLAPGR